MGILPPVYMDAAPRLFGLVTLTSCRRSGLKLLLGWFFFPLLLFSSVDLKCSVCLESHIEHQELLAEHTCGGVVVIVGFLVEFFASQELKLDVSWSLCFEEHCKIGI